MRKAWLLFLLCGIAGMVVGIKILHGHDFTSLAAGTMCIECTGVRVIGNEVAYAKGVELGFREGRFNILTKDDIFTLKRTLFSSKKKMTIIVFSGECEGCLFAEKLAREIAVLNPSYFAVQVVREGEEGYSTAADRYGMPDALPAFAFIDRSGTMRGVVAGTDALKERVMNMILALEGVA